MVVSTMPQFHWKQFLFALFIVCSAILQLSVCENQTCHGVNSGIWTRRLALNDLRKLSVHIENPNTICALDLSNGNVSDIPSGVFTNFSNLVNLSLANNNLEYISKGAFAGLGNLRHLDLSMNRIQILEDSNITASLLSLRSLDMTGNNNWSPSNNLLQLHSLQEIRGVSWSQQCYNCTLNKPEKQSEELRNFRKGEYHSYIKGSRYPCRAKLYRVKNIPKNFATFGFMGNCLKEGTKCFESEVTTEITYPCWDITRQVGGLNYLFGPVAIILNLCVFVTTLWSSRLRRNVAMLLVANLAFADFLNGIYSLAITVVRQQRSFQEMLVFMKESCKFVGFPWMIATEVSVNTLLLLAIERFISIVYSTRPQLKMTPRSASIGLGIIWVYSLVLAILPLVGIASYSITLYCIPIYPVRSIPAQFWFSFYVTGTIAIIYLVTIPLYIRIYLSVRSSGLRTGKRTDVALAKRIFVLVVCNMFFFFLPVAISLIWTWSGTLRSISRVTTEVLTSAFSVVCLTVSSALNPLLYAFQSSAFREELRSLYHRTIKRLNESSSGSVPSTNVYHLKRSTSGTSLDALKTIGGDNGRRVGTKL